MGLKRAVDFLSRLEEHAIKMGIFLMQRGAALKLQLQGMNGIYESTRYVLKLPIVDFLEYFRWPNSAMYWARTLTTISFSMNHFLEIFSRFGVLCCARGC